MAIKVTREQRDAIYGEILVDLTGTGDIYTAINGGDFDSARRYRRRFEDDMRLLDDLGWESERDSDEFELTMSAIDLARALRHLTDNARSTVHNYVVEPVEESEHTLRAITAKAIYGDLLTQVAENEASPRPEGPVP